jgi:hypothetical protein
VKGLTLAVERLEEQMAARTRVPMLAVILAPRSAPPWADLLPDGRCVRLIGGDSAPRRSILRQLRKGTAELAGAIALSFRSGASDFIVQAVSVGPVHEVACFGARGDGKSYAGAAACMLYADLHRAAGFPLPVHVATVAGTHAEHRAKLVRTLEAPAWRGLWHLRDDKHEAVCAIGGQEHVVLHLLGVEDQSGLDRLRGEFHGVWFEEPAPAALMEVSSGLSEDAWGLALTSLGDRLPSYRHPAFMTLNYPDEDHWTWQRFVVRRHPGTAFVRILPGERASVEDRARWAQNLDGRPDLRRRLLDGEPGVVQLGPAVAVGYRSEVHRATARLRPVEGIPLVLGHDGGLTPVTIIVQHVAGELRVLAALASERAGTRQHLEHLVRPWLALHAPGVLRAGGALLRHRYDPSMQTGEQADIDTDPVRVLRELLGGPMLPGPTTWPGRRDPMLAVFNRLNPQTGRAVLQLDPVEAALLDRALAGRWYYPIVHGGVVSRDLPKKPNHPWEDLGDAFCYALAGVGLSRASDDETRSRQQRAHSVLGPSLSWRQPDPPSRPVPRW